MTNEGACNVLENCAFYLKDGTKYMKPEHEQQFRQAYEMAIEALKAQKFGKWIMETDEFGDIWMVCSACREKYCTSDLLYYPNYCPKCGAKMGREEEA